LTIITEFMDARISRRARTLRFSRALACAGFLTCFAAAALADFQGATHMMPFDEEIINYSKTPASNSVARLEQTLETGKVQLRYDREFGYLPALLDALSVSTNSQMLVFSKTSFQRERISPQTPRALYFNDNVYVGFIPGAPLMEVSVADPKLGAVFYTLDASRVERPRLVRTDQCLECHASTKSMGVPGHLVRSFMTDESGVVDLITGVSMINHRTPLAERWGGWYVTGTHGAQTHRGNLIGKAAFERQDREPNYLGNRTNLTRLFDTSRYPTGQSDIVALMVLEHQTHLHNFVTRLNYAAELALQQYGHVKYLKSASEAFLKYLLFTEETPLTAPVKGNSGFAESFAALGPKDKTGRSLRDFDLQTRLFKYPCSFLIYSEAFDALPSPLKDQLYHRLWEILTSPDPGADFARIPVETRRAIYEILIETKQDLPAYWTQPASKEVTSLR
jgi:hypothetical protein